MVEPTSQLSNPPSNPVGPTTGSPAGVDGESVIVATAHGELKGKWLGGVARFAGIPFAAPPVGDLRFCPPAPPAAWDGVRDATAFGPICPQNPSMMDLLFGGESEEWNEDCLYLNVWSNAVGSDEKRPVMVWIHGGGFEMGSGSSPLYRGDSFARDGVVFVSINYRLGSLGFLELGGLDPSERGSANAGLLDQVAALRWVSENIAAFGGDPSRVTVFGESAGAMSVSLLLASPAAKGLFQQVITQSGAASACRTIESADDDTSEFMSILGAETIEDLRAAPVEDLLKAHSALGAARLADPAGVMKKHGNPLAFLAFRPVADGEVVPLDPIAAIRGGSASGVSLISGTNLEEWKLFSIGSKPVEDEAALIARFANLVDDPEVAYDAYRREFPGANLSELECAFMTDFVFRIPSDQLVRAQLEGIASADGPAVYQYRFDWRSEAMGGLIGAAHAVEIPFVFDLLSDQRLHVLLGVDAPRELSELVHGSWVDFAELGDPGWGPTGPGSRVVQIFGDETAVAVDPMPTVTGFWAKKEL